MRAHLEGERSSGKDKPKSTRLPIGGKLGWAQIPGTPSQIDGVPGLFKMLHVLAKR